MLLFYHPVMESIIRYGISAWCGNLPVLPKSQITRLTQTAMRISEVRKHHSAQAIFEQAVIKMAERIGFDPPHVLQSDYKMVGASEPLSVGSAGTSTPLYPWPSRR